MALPSQLDSFDTSVARRLGVGIRRSSGRYAIDDIDSHPLTSSLSALELRHRLIGSIDDAFLIHGGDPLISGLRAVQLRLRLIGSIDDVYSMEGGGEAVRRVRDCGCGHHRQESNCQHALHSHDILLMVRYLPRIIPRALIPTEGKTSANHKFLKTLAVMNHALASPRDFAKCREIESGIVGLGERPVVARNR